MYRVCFLHSVRQDAEERVHEVGMIAVLKRWKHGTGPRTWCSSVDSTHTIYAWKGGVPLDGCA